VSVGSAVTPAIYTLSLHDALPIYFFGKHPKLLEMVSRMSDEDVWRLNRGGHDPYKVYAAFNAAVNHEGQPTVILAKTIKGYGMRSEEHTSELQSRENLVCRLLLEK